MQPPGFVELAGRALERVPSATRRRYLDLLAIRLRAMAAVADDAAPASTLVPSAAERRLARQALRHVEGEWNDGDENLVRPWVEAAAGGGDSRALARDLLLRAEELTRIEPHPATVRFFLWAMESVVSGLLESGPPQPERGRAR